MLFLVMALPIINGLPDPSLRFLLNNIDAVLIGAALGWVAGDAFTSASSMVKAVEAVGAVLVAYVVVIRKIIDALKSNNLGSIPRELFSPVSTDSFMVPFRYGTLSFVLFMFLAIGYIYTRPKTSSVSGAA